MSGDDRDARVARGLDALGEFEVAHADGRTHHELGDIDLDEVGDLARTTAHFDAEHLLVDLPVGVADFDRVTDEVQGYLGHDGLVGVDDLEVDVRDGAAHRVTLDLARQHGVGGAVGVEGDE